MRIKTFSTFIKKKNLQKHILQNSTIVVDAHNFFFRLYTCSGLQYVFGCESDKYADYLRNYLSMFKKANVKCYFIFKGGHEDTTKRRGVLRENSFPPNFDINKTSECDAVLPIFMKDVYKQVLDEMGFDYTVCEFESKKECIAFAQKLKCPVISYDIKYCFSDLPYIMQSTLRYDELNNWIECGIFSLDNFLKKYHLTKEKLAIFAALTDEDEFPENHFIEFMKSLKVPLNNDYQRNEGILLWLATNMRQNVLYHIFHYTNQEDKSKFLDMVSKNKEMLRKQEEPGIPAIYLQNGNQIEFTDKDEFWFQKGVASKHIAIQFVNLVHTEIFERTWAIADYSDVDPRLFSVDIIKYAFNLLTNFKKEHLILFMNKEEIVLSVTKSIQKPEYVGNSPFENGWNYLKGELFEHFLTEVLQRFNFEEINKLPEDLRMLMTALIYFSKKKTVCTRNQVCSIILSYIALGVVGGAENNKKKEKYSEDAIRKDSINDLDKMVAKRFLAKYLTKVGMEEAKMLFDVALLHPLVEFQHCLENLNYLNVLCGKLFKPTIYSKTYNGTFVYKVLHNIMTKHDGNCMDFLKKELESAPTVLSFVLSLMNLCDTQVV